MLFRAISASINSKLAPLTEQANTLIMSTGIDWSDLVGNTEEEVTQCATAVSPKAVGRVKRWNKKGQKQSKPKGTLAAMPLMSAPRLAEGGLD